MTEEQPFHEWIEAQPPKVQLAIALPAFLLSTWYTRAGEDSTMQFRLLEHFMGIRGPEITTGVRAYLHLIHGDNPEFPAAAREFLARSPELVVPILRSFLREHLDTKFLVSEDRFGEEEIDNVVTILTMSVLFPEEMVRKAEVAIAALKERIRFTVIGEGVEAHARAYLDNGGVTSRHPAHAFLAHVVEIAPQTRELPARAAELAALIGPPQ